MKRNKEKVLKIRIGKEGKDVTFKIPQGIGGWYKFFMQSTPLLKNIRYIGVTIAMLTVVNMHDIFQQIQFSQELTGTLVWAFVLLGMVSWGFK